MSKARTEGARVSDVVERAREAEGWRTGRPKEDPAKTKGAGLVQAKPSEFLVHVRGGKVRTSSSGQGASCFKLPWDSVAVIPTSLQQLSFRADQVTLERVGVEVSGVAVYRIAAPLLAYRVLNFSFPERAQEKLEQTLTAMFVGAARRIVANLALDDVLQRRKAALADELLGEIAPILGGSGRPDDESGQGWGVVIDTIEIQEVRVLSETLFAQMQAPFRLGLERRAREAKAEADKEIAAREAACARAVEEAKIAQALAVSEKRRELFLIEQTHGREREERVARNAAELASTKARIAAEQRAEAQRQEAVLVEQARVLAVEARQKDSAQRITEGELKKKEAVAQMEVQATLLEAARLDAELARVSGQADLEREQAQMAVAEARAQLMLRTKRGEAEVQAIVDESRARVRTAEQLPVLAAAVGQKIGEVRVTQIGEGASPFGFVADAVSSVIGLADLARRPTTTS